MKKLCVNCRNLFETARNIPNQSYCTDIACQKARKAAWVSQKLASDTDYKTNQRRAQKSWQKANPDYWKKYREQRDASSADFPNVKRRKRSGIEEPIPGTFQSFPFDGLFELRVISQNRHVKIDVYIVEIKRYKGSRQSGKNVKR